MIPDRDLGWAVYENSNSKLIEISHKIIKGKDK
jgi:hypothetical protein